MPKGGKIVSALDELRRTLRNSPEFQNWFGKSQIADASGLPSVVYHGAPDARFVKDDGIFKTLKEKYGRGPDPENRAFWFSGDYDTAKSYADDRRAFDYQGADPAVIAAFLKMENPLIVDGGGKQWREVQARGKTSDVIAQAKAAGHDGVIIKNVRDRYQNTEKGTPTTTYTVFDPAHIKSVENEGTFDPTNPSIHKAKGGRIVSALEQLKREADYLEWVKGTKAVTPEGNPLTVYHGANRLDRLVDKIRPERSTSGPMPFFTANPDIASNYAKGKTDNSIEDAGYEHWFQYRPKGARSDQPVDRLWWDMTPEQKKAFHERMPNIREDDEREHILHDPTGGMAVPGTYEMYLQRERGNGIAAARELWLNSGALFGGDEHKFMNVLREAGAPLENVSFTDFNHGAPGVMPAHLSVKNPLVTSDIPPHVVEALDDAASRTRKPVAKYGADPWDKATRDPDEWMQALKTDLEEGTQLAWSSIPDWVTKTLTKLGYDGIHDFGGKLGGEKHDVWVPFTPEQVRSSITKKARGGRVAFAKGGKVTRTAMDELKEYANALAPQKGMFSTLDKLIEQAPFEKGSIDQWRGYLKPGRAFEREGVQFPLKKEELDYAFDPSMRTTFGERVGTDEPFTKEQVLEAIRTQRPEFRVLFSGPEKDAYKTALQLGNEKEGIGAEGRAEFADPSYGPENDPRLSHQSPDSVYEESGTLLKGLNYPNHFTPDTMSWARTSSHELPSGEKMRLIEEIQSDLHQKAAEREWNLSHPDWRRHALKQAGLWKEYADADEEIARINNERLQLDMRGDHDKIFELGKQENALREKKQELVDRLPGLNPRLGYITPEELSEFRKLDQIRNQVSDSREGSPLWTEGGETDDRWTPAMRDRRDQLSEKLGNAPPDAPFKDPREYAALEMKKQLLNAAHNDEDYLALTRGSDQRERYGGAGEGTEYFYDQLYPSEMAKLAKKYGAEMTEVEAPLGSSSDTRPEWMRESEIETPEDFNHSWKEYRPVEPQTMDEEKIIGLRDMISKIDPNNRELIRDLQSFREDHRHPGYDDGDLQDRWNNMVDHLTSELGNQLDEGTHVTTPEKKTFPAIKLTPEIREKIKKAGVPLWSVGAGAAGLEMLQHPDEASAEEVGHTTGGGFAEGGSVSTLDQLKDLAKRFGLGFSTQWSGLDPKGKARSAIYNDYEAPRDQWSYNPEAGMDLPPQRGVRPGMVDELASLPSLAATLGTLGHYQGPQFSQDAGKRAQDLDEALRVQMDVKPPEGVLQHAAEAAGAMFGQIPVPFEAPATESAGVARRVLGPIAEWFSPTIKPSIANYAVGTGAGTALTMGIPKAIEKLDEIRNSDDPWRLAAAAAKSGELPPELAFQIANHLAPQGDDMKFRQEVPDEENKEFADSF